MIDKEEIFSIASSLHLLLTTIEKDYVLSWVLFGIHEHPLLSEILVFKGGTCLKKCFFANYRFSEDLDFVLIDKSYLNAEFFLQAFREVCSWIQEASNIEFISNLFQFEEYLKIKIDISSNESLVLKPENRKILHTYSDSLSNGGKIASYSFAEIFAEKIRALADRARPRDLFDVIHLNTQKEYTFDKSQIRFVLKKKCENRKIDYPSLSSIIEHPYHQLLLTEWDNMLGHQISSLKPMKTYLDQLPRLFDWISQIE